MPSVVSLPRFSKQRCSSSSAAFRRSSCSKRLAELPLGKRGSAGITLHYLTPVRLFRHTPLMSFISPKPRLAPTDFLPRHWFTVRTHHTCPPAFEESRQIAVAIVSHREDQPVSCERPGLVGVLPTGVGENIPLSAYLSALQVLSCS